MKLWRITYIPDIEVYRIYRRWYWWPFWQHVDTYSYKHNAQAAVMKYKQKRVHEYV